MLVLVVTVTAPLFPPLVCPVVLNRDRVSPATELGLI